MVQACDRYEAAWKLQQDNAAALYNWGVALSDIALSVKVHHISRLQGIYLELLAVTQGI
jgi:hypothetical protein